MSGVMFPRLQVRVQEKGCGLSMIRYHWSCSHIRVVCGWCPGCGLTGRWVCHHSSDFSGLGNGSCWAQGQLELAQGPPLCHPIGSEKTAPFLHLLMEGSSMV